MSNEFETFYSYHKEFDALPMVTYKHLGRSLAATKGHYLRRLALVEVELNDELFIS